MEDALVTLDHISKSFGETRVVDDLTLSVRRGEFLSVLGPSGCGKTTMLRVTAGLLAPDAGRVYINGADVTRLPPEKRAVNTVFQNYALFPHMNVEKNIAYGLRMRGVDRKTRAAKVAEMLELIRLPGYGKRMPQELSGGQRQRVAIARAAALAPEALLLDEPLGALDLNLRREMQGELKKLQETLGISFLYITHDQEEALNMSDRVAILNAGKLDMIGTPADIYERPATRFAASFIGEGALIPCAVLSVSDGVCRVSACGGGALARDDGRFRAGDKALLCVRSERVTLSGAPGFDLRGTIVRRRYAGAALRTLVRLADGTLLTAQSAPGDGGETAAGETAQVSWDARHACLVPEDGV